MREFSNWIGFDEDVIENDRHLAGSSRVWVQIVGIDGRRAAPQGLERRGIHRLQGALAGSRTRAKPARARLVDRGHAYGWARTVLLAIRGAYEEMTSRLGPLIDFATA